MNDSDKHPIGKLLYLVIGVLFVLNIISIWIVKTKSDKYQEYFNSPEARYALDKLQLHGYSEDSYDFLMTIQRMESNCLKFSIKVIDKEELDQLRRQAIGHMSLYLDDTPIGNSSRTTPSFTPAIESVQTFMESVKQLEDGKINIGDVLEKATDAFDAWTIFKTDTYQKENGIKDTLREADTLSVKLNGELVYWCYIVATFNVLILFLASHATLRRVKDYVGRRKNIELMISSLSHDLRSPLHIIQISMHEFESDANLKKHKHAFNLIHSSTRSLERLVDDIFRTTRGEELEIKLVPVDIESWFENLSTIYKAKAEDKGVEFKTQSSFGFQVAEIDPDRLSQCVGNIIDNAVKYTPAKSGKIQVDLHAMASVDDTNLGILAFTVTDNGRGIFKKDFAHIYAPFVRGDGTADVRGLGLGLSIFKRLASTFNARYSFDSKVGQGTKFTIDVPVAINTDNSGTLEDAGFKNSQGGSIQPSANTNEILVVDDEKAILKMTAAILREMGFEVDTVTTSEKALAKINECSYEVVLTDINMSGLSGIELAKIIKTGPGKRPYVIGMSANRFNVKTDPSIAIFDQLLEKPFDAEKLADAIGQYEQLKD
jgi:signal transduction histidine kinase/CheY-like chemotaxis protein